ncbi:FecR domain-containing protein [Mucilaginibacter sp. CAU 1740]|uniref:FecR family protein n=1 Tax=Mucilaginibacter oryzae TaxID=468058 RepID=A0A316GZS8_9SPHI|nr:FecR domain-containing protein [Mucilaginibacter oryzae]PWK70839.1 FecR family protein [Mucilaginibacter oryzae]
MSRGQANKLLDRYLNGTSTKEENAQIENWLDKSNDFHSEWSRLNSVSKAEWLSSVFRDINNTVHTPDVVHLKRSWSRFGTAVAAAILVIASFTYLFWPLLQSRRHPVELTTIYSPNGTKKQIILADGSRVWMNAGSALRYAKIFNGKVREVYLLGEAYFNIIHDKSRPFIIHTGNVVTTVLGTSFNVKEDKRNHIVEVTVHSGKVSVANGNKLLGVLTPNQQIKFNTLKNELVRLNVDIGNVVAWQQNSFNFDDISFADAALKLQKHFNVKIGFRNEQLKNCRFSGTSIKGDRLDEILKVICAFNHATFETKPDGSIIIEGSGCN